MESTSVCHIEKLPNEIPRLIFHNLTISIFRAWPNLVVRQVSRRFRWIANEVEFWQDENFNFSDLLHSQEQRKHAHAVRALLTDDDFKRVLSRRRRWSFSNIQMLFATASVPEICRNTRSITFNYFKDHTIENAVEFLAIFSAPTRLTIDFDVYMECDDSLLNLGTIVDSCPLLEILSLQDVERCSGTLVRAANLKKLNILLCGDEISLRIISPSIQRKL